MNRISEVREAIERHPWVLALSLVSALLIVALVLLPGLGADTTPISDDKTQKIVPAEGETGFPVDVFCKDPLTKVTALPAPDASGITYQLVRVRDGKTETVVYTTGPTDANRTATLYQDRGGLTTPTLTGEQEAKPAFVNDAARDCITDKAE